MASQLLDFSQFEKDTSIFNAEFIENRGYINYNNSGKDKDIKTFTLSLESFLHCLEDIKMNHSEFNNHTNYDEKKWRELSKTYFKDRPAYSQFQVQTKPTFITLSKIIMWANEPDLNSIDPLSNIELDENYLNNSIIKVRNLISLFNPPKIHTSAYEQTIISNKSISQFALQVFKHFYNGNWKTLIENSTQKDSEINDLKYTILHFEPFERLIAKFTGSQSKENLTSSNTLRFFEKEVYSEGSYYYYFSTQWYGKGNYNLTFNKLKDFFEQNFNGYKLKQINNSYTLIKLNEQKNIPFKKDEFEKALHDSGLIFCTSVVSRFISSLITKPFVILSGLSGSGKTKLAHAFADWICQDESQYCIVPVGADWTNREPLLGFPNALKSDEYVKPDNGTLDLMIEAIKHPDLPHFLILDEMNLSHVERYFADFLSVMESNKEITLYTGNENESEIPSRLCLPPNLFIVGTVNIDETTYMFSPKVLDRANVIEFRLTEKDIEAFFNNRKDVDMDKLRTKGSAMAADFLKLAANKTFEDQNPDEITATLTSFFNGLKKAGAEFGYRSATEIIRLTNQLKVVDSTIGTNQMLDIAIMQKLLPKLHGSRRKLCPVLIILGSLCVDRSKIENVENTVFNATEFSYESDGVLYPLSLEKIARMYKGAVENGFASYAEA